MKRLLLPFHTLIISASLLVLAPDVFAREPQTSIPEVKAPPKGYDSKIQVEALVVSDKTVNGDAIVYPKTENPEVRILRVTVPPGAETGWHTHPLPAYGYVISGEITVELADGRKNTVKGGEALIEVVDTLHNGRNTGTEPCVILMVITGEKGTPVTVAQEKPEA